MAVQALAVGQDEAHRILVEPQLERAIGIAALERIAIGFEDVLGGFEQAGKSWHGGER